MNGFIKIHKQILSWEWYNDPNTFRLFIHLLLNANFKSNRWHGVEILPGQLVTGRKVLAEDLKLSEQEIRTSLSKLKSTSEITIQSTNKFSIITICKWEEYQTSASEDQPTKQPTKHQTSNQQSTTLEEGKERKEIKKDIYRQFAHLKLTTSEFQKLIESGYSKEQIDGTLDDIENYKKNGKYANLNLTVRKWLKKNYPEATPIVEAKSQKTCESIFDSLTSERLNAIHQTN